MNSRQVILTAAAGLTIGITLAGPSLVGGPLLPLFLPGPPRVLPGPSRNDLARQEVLELVARWIREHPEDRPGWCNLHDRPLEPLCMPTFFHGYVNISRPGRGVAQLVAFPHSALADHIGCCVCPAVPDRLVMGCIVCTDTERAWEAYMGRGGEPIGLADESLMNIIGAH